MALTRNVYDGVNMFTTCTTLFHFHRISAEAAKKAPMPLSSDAITALEQALEPAIESFIAAAVAHSEKKGNGEVGPKDFEAVLKFYKAHKAAM